MAEQVNGKHIYVTKSYILYRHKQNNIRISNTLKVKVQNVIN